jgi:hypothetical protein
MKVNGTTIGRRIGTCADSIIATAESERKTLATLIPMAQAVKDIISENMSDDVFDELEYHFGRIEEFIAKWRPSGDPAPDYFYLQPNWAESIDNEAQNARKLVKKIKEEFDSGNHKGTIETGNLRREMSVSKGEAFIAMAIDPTISELDDVLDTIKSACDACGINAKRVDDDQSNERITDRIVASIRAAEFVIADLTHARPNVFFEAGFAHGLDKTPIYIAKQGTKLEFDVKDYPIIFFRNMRDLKSGLQKRLAKIAQSHENKGV